MLKKLVSLALMTLLVLAPFTIQAVTLPAPPDGAPLVRENAAPCTAELGYHVAVYDTAPGTAAFLAVYSVYDPAASNPVGSPLIVVVGDKDGQRKAFTIWDGAVTMDSLMAQYPHPCDAVVKYQGSKAGLNGGTHLVG